VRAVIAAAVPLLESAINRALDLDPEAPSVLAPLSGRRIAVHVEGAVALGVLVTFMRDRVSLSADTAGPADVTLRGTPAALVSLLGRDEQLPAGVGVSVSGEIGVLEQLRGALGRLRPDWEEPLARWLGDELGHPLARGLRALMATASRAARELEADTAEYLREESGFLVRREELDEFVEQVDLLRDAVERLDKRVRFLVRKP
jgi:ubiquinone biosynthesis protein UbiJ